MPAHGYMEENGSAAKRTTGVAPGLNLRKLVIPQPSMNKAAHYDFEPRGNITRSP